MPTANTKSKQPRAPTTSITASITAEFITCKFIHNHKLPTMATLCPISIHQLLTISTTISITIKASINYLHINNQRNHLSNFLCFLLQVWKPIALPSSLLTATSPSSILGEPSPCSLQSPSLFNTGVEPSSINAANHPELLLPS